MVGRKCALTVVCNPAQDRKAKKMKPCDCKDEQDTKKLQENGIRHNDDSLVVTPAFVTLTLGHTIITMSMHRFKQFAEWYLADQEARD
jgi:hypothetical protein